MKKLFLPTMSILMLCNFVFADYDDASWITYWIHEDLTTDDKSDYDLTNSGVSTTTLVYNVSGDFTPNDYMYTGANETFEWSAFTCAGWFDAEGASASHRTLIGTFRSGSGNHGWYLNIQKSGAGGAPNGLELLINDGSSSDIMQYAATMTNGVNHVAFGFNSSSGDLFLYVNGTAVGSETAENIAALVYEAGTHVDVEIGRRPDPTNYYNGVLDEWACWDKALTTAEVNAVYNKGDAGESLIAVDASYLNITLIDPTADNNFTEDTFNEFTAQVCCEGADCGEVNVSLDPINIDQNKPVITYTPSRKTICKDGICTASLYSGTHYGYENRQWKTLDKLNSFVNTTDISCVVQSDGLHLVECLDYNLTHRKLKITYKNKLTNTKYIPIIAKGQCDIVGNYTFCTADQTKDIIELSPFTKEQIVTINVNYSQVLKIGENSTLISLHDNNTELLGDSYTDFNEVDSFKDKGSCVTLFIAGNTNYNFSSYFSFNLSELDYDTIHDAKFLIYIMQNYLDSDTEGFNVSAFRINETVTEGTECSFVNNSCTGTEFCSGNEHTYTDKDGSLKFFGGAGEPTQWQSWNVTNIVDTDKGGNTNIILVPHDIFGTPTSDYFYFRSRESTLTNYGPYLNITYTEGSPPSGNNKTGLIPVNSGTPFYVNSSNPVNISLSLNECQNTTWWVNATGTANTTHEFYAFANVTSDMSINNMTDIINITIVAAVDSCTCPGAGNSWEWDFSDTCTISSACIGITEISCVNTGSITISAEVEADNLTGHTDNQTIYLSTSPEGNLSLSGD